jgi:hypothetical protein
MEIKFKEPKAPRTNSSCTTRSTVGGVGQSQTPPHRTNGHSGQAGHQPSTPTAVFTSLTLYQSNGQSHVRASSQSFMGNNVKVNCCPTTFHSLHQTLAGRRGCILMPASAHRHHCPTARGQAVPLSPCRLCSAAGARRQSIE